MANYGKFCNFSEPLIKYRIKPLLNKSVISNKNLYSNVFANVIKTNTLTIKEKEYLLCSQKKIDHNSAYFEYYYFIAKKFLWNNYNRKLARNNLIIALRIRFSVKILFLLIVSLLNERFLIKFYKIFKLNKIIKKIWKLFLCFFYRF
jgi:hypothetical protein